MPAHPLMSDPRIKALNGDFLTVDDLVNIVLQRSAVLWDVPKAGKLILAWSEGDDAPLRAAAAKVGPVILQRAACFILEQYEVIRPHLNAAPPKRIADIGSGMGLFDLFAMQDFDCHATLIDIEEGKERSFGYKANGAGYMSLNSAATMFEANGIAADRFALVNPKHQDYAGHAPFDWAVSFISCGFHYPLNVYAKLFEDCVPSGGRLLLDVRRRTKPQFEYLETLGTCTLIQEYGKANQTLVVKS